MQQNLKENIYELKLNDVIIEARPSDNFINATQMCKAGGKELNEWYRLESTRRLITTLRETIINENNSNPGVGSENMNQNIENIILVDIKKGGDPKKQGTWIHPRLATCLAMWISPIFALKISEWIEEWKVYSLENEVKYYKALSELKPSKNQLFEYKIKKELKKLLKAKEEIETEFGFIDLMTNDAIIEIKNFNNWKHALGQILSYGVSYPDKKKIIYLFGDINKYSINSIEEIYLKYDIELRIYDNNHD